MSEGPYFRTKSPDACTSDGRLHKGGRSPRECDRPAQPLSCQNCVVHTSTTERILSAEFPVDIEDEGYTTVQSARTELLRHYDNDDDCSLHGADHVDDADATSLWRRMPVCKAVLSVSCMIGAFGLLIPVLPTIKTRFFHEVTDCTLPGTCSSVAAEFSGMTDSVTAGIAAVIVPMLGHLSDKHGRKKPLILVTVLNFVPIFTLLLYVVMGFSLYLYFAALALSVGQLNSMSLWRAMIADLTCKKERQRAFAGLGFATMGWTLPSVGISVLHAYGETALVVSAASLGFLSVLSALFLEETLPAATASPSHQLNLLRTTTLDTETSFWRCQWPHVVDLPLICVVMALSIFPLQGMYEIILFYVKDHLHFTLRQNATMLLCVGGTSALAQLFLAFARKPVNDKTLVLVGSVCNLAHMIGFCVVTTASIMYVNEFISGGSMLALVGLQSMASKRASETEQGTVNGILGSVAAVACMVAPLFFGMVYGEFRSSAPTAPFYAGSACLVVALLCATRLKTQVPDSVC
eukprot:GEMP01024848.1.p1 GENE.GEMP01024848.1~~GEMP01024848.1.p1  ORF type:complete len:521 (+),score=101.46 GEMP01024848.1:247-1809(+)